MPNEHKIRLVEDPWATVRHLVEVFALVGAGAWAFYTFIYQEKIKPAGEPATLVTTISVTRVGHDRTRDILEVASRLHNGGKTEIDIAADAYNVWGDRYATAVTHTSRDTATEHAVNDDEPRVSRRLISSFVELRDAAVGGKHAVHSTLEPDGDVVFSYTIVIPRGAYDVIHAQVIAIPVKTPVRQRINVRITRKADGSFSLGSSTPGVFEDDNGIDFGLIPD